MMVLEYISNLIVKILDRIIGYKEREYETYIGLYRKNKLVAIIPKEVRKPVELGGKRLIMKGSSEDVYNMLEILKKSGIKYTEV